MEIEDGIHTALLTLKEGYEGTMTSHNIEVGVGKMEGKGENAKFKFRLLTPAEIADYLEEVE